MRDWNNNGDYDFEDGFIDYHIHRSMSGKCNNSGSSEVGQEVVVVIGVVLLVLGIFILFA